jgi:hypothetical protein
VLRIDEQPARLENAPHLGERALGIRDGAKDPGGDDRVEGVVIEGQVLRPFLEKLDGTASLLARRRARLSMCGSGSIPVMDSALL